MSAGPAWPGVAARPRRAAGTTPARRPRGSAGASNFLPGSCGSATPSRAARSATGRGTNNRADVGAAPSQSSQDRIDRVPSGRTGNASPSSSNWRTGASPSECPRAREQRQQLTDRPVRSAGSGRRRRARCRPAGGKSLTRRSMTGGLARVSTARSIRSSAGHWLRGLNRRPATARRRVSSYRARAARTRSAHAGSDSILNKVRIDPRPGYRYRRPRTPEYSDGQWIAATTTKRRSKRTSGTAGWGTSPWTSRGGRRWTTSR